MCPRDPKMTRPKTFKFHTLNTTEDQPWKPSIATFARELFPCPLETRQCIKTLNKKVCSAVFFFCCEDALRAQSFLVLRVRMVSVKSFLIGLVTFVSRGWSRGRLSHMSRGVQSQLVECCTLL